MIIETYAENANSHSSCIMQTVSHENREKDAKVVDVIHKEWSSIGDKMSLRLHEAFASDLTKAEGDEKLGSDLVAL